ncbi:MAG: HNH endonuclease [Cyclobacteriaceae bacterium]
MAVAGRRQHGGNDGYVDDPTSVYRWDSTVPNHAQLEVGDRVVLWDKQISLGASTIQTIEHGAAEKAIHRCPGCRKTNIKARTKERPRYRCYKCKSEFDRPITTGIEVHTYAATYRPGWVDLGGLLTGSQLRALCESPKSQHAIRRLRRDALQRALTSVPGARLDNLEAAERVTGGFEDRMVRARLGQTAFRARLMLVTGAICAVGGATPPQALEACHLYSYAKHGKHYEDGGLLMRRDLHHLFDLGLIAVHPDGLTVDVAPDVASYPAYEALQGRPLAVPLDAGQRRWLSLHWRQHRGMAAEPRH